MYVHMFILTISMTFFSHYKCSQIVKIKLQSNCPYVQASKLFLKYFLFKWTYRHKSSKYYLKLIQIYYQKLAQCWEMVDSVNAGLRNRSVYTNVLSFLK